MRNTGKNVNTTTSDATATTLPATNASPLKKPRPASPIENSIANAVTISAAPSPMPYWPPASAGSVLTSASRYQPVGPMAKPWAKKYRKPAAPMPMSASARRRRATPGSSSSAARPSSAPSGRSQPRPCRSTCNQAGAASLLPKCASQPRPNTLSCSEYHGTRRKPVPPTASQNAMARRGSVMVVPCGQRFAKRRRAPDIRPDSAIVRGSTRAWSAAVTSPTR